LTELLARSRFTQDNRLGSAYGDELLTAVGERGCAGGWRRDASVYQIVGPAPLRTASAPKNPLRTQASKGLRASSNAIRVLTGVAGPLGAMLLHVALFALAHEGRGLQ